MLGLILTLSEPACCLWMEYRSQLFYRERLDMKNEGSAEVSTLTYRKAIFFTRFTTIVPLKTCRASLISMQQVSNETCTLS